MSITFLNDPALQAVIQQDLLERQFQDALFPELLFRNGIVAEPWAANMGETKLKTVKGTIQPVVTPLSPDQDPTASSYETEQYRIEARQFADSISVYMPASYVALDSLFMNNMQQIGMAAGQSLNRVARNNLFQAYMSGNTCASANASAGTTQIEVVSLAGFIEKNLNGRLQPISAANPLIVTNVTASEEYIVIASIPDDPNVPTGAGRLLLSTGTTNAVTSRDAIVAANGAFIRRSGGGSSVDAIVAADIVTLQDFIEAVAQLRTNNVQPMNDGFYHAHISPATEAQMFQDDAIQRQLQSQPSGNYSDKYRKLYIGELAGIKFYRNNELPSASNVSSVVDNYAAECACELVNAGGVRINRDIVLGKQSIEECYIDESKYITEAGTTGKIGNWSVTNNGLAISTERIRMIIRAPLDKLQQKVDISWSWSGDFGVRTDETAKSSPARFKRAVVIEHA